MIDRLSTLGLLIGLGFSQLWSVSANPSNQTAETNQGGLELQVEDVAVRLLGVMETSIPASADAPVTTVRMTTCRVTVADTDPAIQKVPAIFLYQEQALVQRLNQPYRQRFLRIAPSHKPSHSGRQISLQGNPQSIESLSFKPEQPATWVNFCEKSEAERVVQSDAIGKPICSVFLKRSGKDYVGRTPVDGCPANVRGAVRITNRIVLHSTGMDTWDRGFDSTGKQVWGAKTESYRFRRIQP